MPSGQKFSGHTDSYYADSRHDRRLRPPLEGELTVDVCVIGAGFTGISSALFLAEAGFTVAVLEAACIGYGASGRNGGQLVNSYSRDLDTIEKNYGAAVAGALGAMAFEGGDIIRARIKDYKIDCDYQRGGIFAALNKKQFVEMAAQQKLWQSYGHKDLQLLDQQTINQHIGSERYVGGLLDNRGGHLHPLNLLLGEACALESLGGQIFEKSAALRFDKKDTPIVYTENGRVQAHYLLLAGNAYLGDPLAQQLPELTRKSMPCGSQIITTERLDVELAASLIPGRQCVEDGNYKLDYYRMTADHRLLYGGGVTYGGGDPASIGRFLRKNLEKTFPQLRGVAFDYAWGGDFLLTLSRLPQLGRLSQNIYYAQGYSGHGVTTTHLAGKCVAEAIGGQPERFDAFACLPHAPFPGGRLMRVPYTALGAIYYGLRDQLGL